jgi:ABC-type Fe3+/spermidine/putrescine transport system ATPase subunit
MTESHIRIDRVNKSFGAVQALREVSIDIPRGSFTTFLGPSGCGKTTMLRTIAGFYSMDAGAIHIGGRLVNNVPSHQRKAIMVFQDYGLFPHMNIGANIAYGLKINKVPRERIRERVARTVEYLGIQGLESRSPGQLSGGQQQRVALARALVMEPEVLLLDEPLSNLDAKLRMSIRAELRQLQKRLGITTVYVTHDQAEALALSDQIAVMNRGRVIQIGTPWEIYYKPKSAFVADFVGTANLLTGRVTERSGASAMVNIGQSVLRVEETSAEIEPGQEVTLCIRPETVRLSPGSGKAGPNSLRGVITNHIFEGSSVRYWIESVGRLIIADVFDPSDKGIHEGDVVLDVDPGRIHILSGAWQGPD